MGRSESAALCDLMIRMGLVLAVGLFSVVCMFAQTQTAQVSGLITDPARAVVPKASVTFVNEDNSVVRTAESNAEGYYVAPLLPAGNYTITVTALGFQTERREGVRLEVAQSARIDFGLAIKNTRQSVQVSASASPLNRDNAELSSEIAPATLKELPIIVGGGPRTAAAVVTLFPGVTSPTNDTLNAHLNGGSSYEGESIVDGVSIDYPAGGNGLFDLAFDFIFTPEMISEVKVLTSNFEPEYGNSPSSAIIMETKSGTNAFHGTFFEFLRNTALNTRQYGSADRFKDIENNFGGSIGGPVKIPYLWTARSRPFFFVDLEAYRVAGGLSQPTLSLPSMQERNGDFRDWVDTNGKLIPIYDPATTRIVNGQVVRDQFMGCNGNTPNVICPSDPRLQTSLAQKWFQFLPAPTSPGPLNNFLETTVPGSSLGVPTNFLDIRFDEYWADKDHVNATIYDKHFLTFTQCVLGVPLCNGAPLIGDHRRVDRISWDHTLSPTVLNHLAFGYNVTRYLQVPSDLKYADQLPQIPGVESHSVPPQENFSDGFYSWGSNFGPLSCPAYNYNLNDMVTWVHGKHALKFGGELRRSGINNHPSRNLSGTFNFARGETGLAGVNSGNPIASLLLEQVDSANEMVYSGGADFTDYSRQHTWIAHIGDTWKATPKLSINYGLRYDLKPPSVEKYDRMSFFNPSQANPAAGGRPGTLAFAGSSWGAASFGAPYPERVFYKGFAPRLGIAYSLTPRTVIRTGYGIFYSGAQYPGWYQGVFTDGFSANPTFSSSLGGLQAAFVLSQGLPQNFARPPFIDSTFLNGQAGPHYRPLEGNRLPYSQEWNLNVEHRFTNSFYVSAAYVGNKGTRLYTETAALNALNPSLLSMGSKLNDQFGPTDTVVDGVSAPYPGWAQQLASCAPSVAQALVPYPQYCGTLQGVNENSGNSTFESFQFKAEHQASHGIWILASYTNSKLLTDVESNQPSQESGTVVGVISPFERKRNKSLSSADIPQTLSIAVTYNLPFGQGGRWLSGAQGALGKVVGGWQATTVFRASSAPPFFFNSSVCNVPPQFAAACIPAVLPGANPFAQDKSHFDPNKPLFNSASFESPDSFNFYLGQGPRVSNIRGFGYHNQDFALIKDIHITERVQFEFRAEVFNLWNWHIFATQGNPFVNYPNAFTTDVASPSFGMWNGSVTAPRNIQLGARITY
jgi:Carboxypeptidase regulatory-like domain